MKLEIFFTKSSIKELSSIDKETAISIKDKILNLSSNPKPQGFKKLKGRKGYRIRVGNYRIIYETDFAKFINILHIGHRKDIYK
jgi:mRNA interferase RelE/StbE